MRRTILKRDGSTQEFYSFKIEDAIKKAFASRSQKYDPAIFEELMQEIEDEELLEVEKIQDAIELLLHRHNHFEVLKSFITYRFLHKLQREKFCENIDSTTFVDSTRSVEEYINKEDWRINANANISYSNAGLVNNLAGKLVANYWLDRIYDKAEGYAHRNGNIHIHDLDNLSGYCAGWSLRALLDEEFNGVRGRVESRPPNHLREALGQMVNFLGILQSEWAGAQAFSSFDTYLAPYLFKDKLTQDELKKALRGFVYNLNVPSRWGQSPFTNVTIDWSVPSDLADQIPTRHQRHLFSGLEDAELLAAAKSRNSSLTSLEEMTYRDFHEEMKRIDRAFFEILTEGDASGQPFTFPIPTVNITEDFDFKGENCDVLFENTAQIGSAYFQNFVGSQYIRDESGNLAQNPNAYKPGHVRSMCCRLQLDLRELLKRGGGLFGSAEMTGSIGVVTINMARLGYLHKGDKEALYGALDRLLEIAYSTLEKKRVVVNRLFEQGLYPYTKRYLHNFNNHFSTIGVNGINEMLRNFSGDAFDLTCKEGIAFALETLEYIRARIALFQERSGNLYNLEATPAEGTTYRFAKEDAKRYKGIIQAGTPPNIYYTNSSQLPVGFSDDPFEALSLQDELQCKYTGGTVLHLYMSERLSSAEATKRFVKNVIYNYRLPYITVTPLFSICPIHGYLAGEHEFCPQCDALLAHE
ncbi:MAG: ribonucleoside triphosphate reductase [Epsilonproteobacteria bacterium]|nr:ribonucleoside triphosphate reductase [Campylobacterota bacterium]